jgi:Domain of unknown function (DUF222)
MDSNTHSTSGLDGLGALAAELQGLADQPRDGLPDAARAERVMALQDLADRLQGHLLRELADVDARGAAGAEQGTPAPSTAGWLRARLRLSPTAATGLVRTARALYRGPLAQTGQALTEGAISPAHAQVLAAGTHKLPRPPRGRGRASAAGGGPAAGPAPPSPGDCPPAPGRRPRRRRPPG